MSEQLSLFDRIVIDTPPSEAAIAEAMRTAIERYRAERPPLERNHTVPGKNPVSHDAARRAFGRSGNARERIYNVIKAHPEGLTVHELRQLITMHFHTVAARVSDLNLEGWLVDSGQRRPTDTGAMATVWVVASE
jgi:hypothetical protein